MDTVKVMQVIETQLVRHGDGTKRSPIRIITQYWDMEGKLIFEIDPCASTIPVEKEVDFASKVLGEKKMED
jgi:hypothetical protein